MDDLQYLAAETGLSPTALLAYLDISPSTWRRWKRSGAPKWAWRLLRLRAGYLDDLGWPRWQIRAGRLYCSDLHWSYSWSPGEIIAGRKAVEYGAGAMPRRGRGPERQSGRGTGGPPYPLDRHHSAA